jgi:hypothetical protein
MDFKLVTIVEKKKTTKLTYMHNAIQGRDIPVHYATSGTARTGQIHEFLYPYTTRQHGTVLVLNKI